jgi:hypothetical protein
MNVLEINIGKIGGPSELCPQLHQGLQRLLYLKSNQQIIF